MMRGIAKLELSFIVDDDVLSEIGVESHSKKKLYGMGCALSSQERDAIWAALPRWLQEKLLDEAAGNAEPEADDSACDDERISKGAA